jgi:membrane fusion protein (multidrug efflux system)
MMLLNRSSDDCGTPIRTWLRRRRPFSLATGLLISLAGLSGCGEGNVYHEPPPPEVIVTPPVTDAVTSYVEYVGTAQAFEKVELRARVKGFLRQKLFKDGAEVKAGQLLFVIDEEQFQVRLEQAKARYAEAEAALRKAQNSKIREVAQAQLDLDEAQLGLARLEEARYQHLVARNASSREDLDRAEATRKKNEAQVASDKANLEQAKADYEVNILAAKSSVAAAHAEMRTAEIDLGYCRISAPIDGWINHREFDVGNFVGDGQSTVLATIVRTDPIHAYISISEDDLLRVESMVRQGRQKDYRNEPIPIEMGLGNEIGYPHTGHVDYLDPSIDSGTGTVRIRGVFSNPDGIVSPGLFVRIRMPLERREDALLVPERAISSDQAGQYLLVVGKEDKVERRSVKLGTTLGALREVVGEIEHGDRVVVDGLLRARPGLKVQPKLLEADAALATAGGPQASR